MTTASGVRAFSAGVLFFALCIMPATAADVFWIANPNSSGDWFDPTNWSGGALPGPADIAFIENGSSAFFVSGFEDVGGLNLGGPSTGTLLQSGGNLAADTTVVRAGSLYELGGGTLQVGSQFNLEGTLDFAGGTAQVVADDNSFVDWSQGTLLNAGNVSFSGGIGSTLYLPPSVDPNTFFGSFFTSGEVFNVFGTTLVVPVGFVMHISADRPDRIRVEGTLRPVGSPGSPIPLTLSQGGVEVAAGGTFNLYGASLTLRTNSEVSGGSLSNTGFLTIADTIDNVVTFTQSAGITTVNTDLRLGYAVATSHNPQGTIDLSGGTLTLGRTMLVGTSNNQGASGRFPEGTFRQSGGNVSVGDDLRVADTVNALGTYELSAGSLTVNDQIVLGRPAGDSTGLLNQSGGALIGDSVKVYAGSGYELTGGTLQFSNRFDLMGILDFAGGTAAITAADNAILDWSQGTLLGSAANTTYAAGVDSESYFPFAFNPFARFSSFTSRGLIHTTGTQLIIPSSYLGRAFSINAANVQISGSLTLEAGGQITTSQLTVLGGTLMGSGTLNAALMINDGTIAPVNLPVASQLMRHTNNGQAAR